MDITQGKLVIGLNVNTENEDDKYVALMYNMLLGGGANSKLFQNVREKASLAYTAGSMYIRQKNNIFIRCGIEIKNYNKAKEIIEKQLEDLKNGQFSEEELQNLCSIQGALLCMNRSIQAEGTFGIIKCDKS